MCGFVQILQNHRISIPKVNEADPPSPSPSLSLSPPLSPSFPALPPQASQSIRPSLWNLSSSSSSSSSPSVSSFSPSASSHRKESLSLSPTTSLLQITKSAKESAKKNITKVIKWDFEGKQSLYDTQDFRQVAAITTFAEEVFAELQCSLRDAESFASLIASLAATFGRFMELGLVLTLPLSPLSLSLSLSLPQVR